MPFSLQEDFSFLPSIVLQLSHNFASAFSRLDWTMPAMEQVLVALNNLDPGVYGHYQVPFLPKLLATYFISILNLSKE